MDIACQFVAKVVYRRHLNLRLNLLKVHIKLFGIFFGVYPTTTEDNLDFYLNVVTLVICGEYLLYIGML
jgi:hypothetical protein